MKLKTIYIFLFLILFFVHRLYCQKTLVAQGEYTLRIESYMSEDDAVEKARVYAQINAIESSFGKVIIQGNSTFIQNVSTEKQVETNSVFSFMADSYVNGEWIETISEKKDIFINNDGRWVRIRVKGRIREIQNLVNSCEVFSLCCPSIQCKTTEFSSGQKFYMYFRSPKNGFVSIYMDDPCKKITTRILPYSHYNGGTINFPVTADTGYIFFSMKYDYLKDIANIDELELIVNEQIEQYKIYILYSPSDFSKPILDDYSKEMLTNEQIGANYNLPPALTSEKYQNWQLTVRNKNPEIELQTLMITVRK